MWITVQTTNEIPQKIFWNAKIGYEESFLESSFSFAGFSWISVALQSFRSVVNLLKCLVNIFAGLVVPGVWVNIK